VNITQADAQLIVDLMDIVEDESLTPDEAPALLERLRAAFPALKVPSWLYKRPDNPPLCPECKQWTSSHKATCSHPPEKPICSGCGFAHAEDYPDCVWLKDIG
jgi:hypothetical protein